MMMMMMKNNEHPKRAIAGCNDFLSAVIDDDTCNTPY